MDREIVISGVHTRVRIRRPVVGVVLVDFVGRDTGELGDAPFDELARDLAGPVRPELFIDASQVLGASMDVSGAWAAWLARHRDRFVRLNMLTGSPFVTMTAEFVRRFAALGDQMRIYTDAAAFGAAFRLACDAAERTG